VLAAARSAKVRDFSLVPGLAHVRTQLPVEKALAAITANPWVEYAEPDYVQQPIADPNDTYFGLQWGLHNSGQTINTVPGIPDADIDMPEAWDLTTGDGSFVVAVIDSGTDWSHPDLAANIWTNPGEIPNNRKDDDANGYVDGNTAPSVTIQSPEDGSSFNAGESITFAATVSDEDSGLANSLIWTSDQDGALGEGATISATLSTGTHSVTASVTASGGLGGSATVTVTIVDPDAAPPAAPSGLSAVNNKNNTAKVTWTDNADNETSFELARAKKNKNGTWGSPTSITVASACGTGALVTVIDSCGSGTFRYSVRARNEHGDSAWVGPTSEVIVTRK